MNRRVAAAILGAIVATIGLVVVGTVVITRHFDRQTQTPVAAAEINEQPPAAACDKELQTCFVPVIVLGEARDHPQEAFRAVNDFKKKNQGIVISWPWVFAKKGVYVHWECECNNNGSE